MDEPCIVCGGTTYDEVVCRRPGCGETTAYKCLNCGDVTSAVWCHFHGDTD